MRLTTRGRYAVTAMIDLTVHCEQGAGSVSLHDIAARQDISKQYLNQLFAKLGQHGLVASARGPGGGYRMARAAEQISVADIIDAVNERTNITACDGLANCRNGQTCLTHYLWQDLGQQINQFLANISLAELANRDNVRAIVAEQQRGLLPAQNVAAARTADIRAFSISTATGV